MRLLSIIGLTMLLTACNVAQPQEEPSDPILNQATAQVEQQPFTLKLVSEKEQYRVGEQLMIQAELIYDGDQEEITIAHGGSWLLLETTNVTKNYHFGAAMNEPLIYTKLTKGEPLIEPYHFSGGTFMKGQEGKPYSDKVFQQMAKMEFPPDQYEIKATTHFDLEGNKHKLETHIVFEVVK
ncbi:hypothetical protein P9B03_19095 [Metasolibacillus meyeri]|uniref:DUF4352 domain-containing protein n=1 Tax=Metasolibacillus meyeri TaxID=1071052 RepID=A0AAW9NSD8_9BACL|nr:hypothetical protein [Metasolibacillus meyeri]MEC1180572.1 hypothetical protein [Metasolibacillus meyeri]